MLAQVQSRGHAAPGDGDDDDDDEHRDDDRHGCATIVKTKTGNAIIIKIC